MFFCSTLMEILKMPAALSGQILERINGKSVNAILQDREWHDVRYLRAMLLEVCLLNLSPSSKA